MKKTLTAAASTVALNILAGPIERDRGVGQNPPGVVCAANASRFAAGNFSTPLTAFSVGWRDPENLDELLEFVSPKVISARRGEFKRGQNAEEFLSETDDIRAIGATFKRLELTGEMVLYKTFNKGLTIRIDKDDEFLDGAEEANVGYLMRRLVRNDLRRAVTLLSAAANNTAKTWGTTQNPDRDMRAQCRVALGKSGIWPSRGLISGAAWDLRGTSYESNTSGNAAYFMRAAKTPTEVAQFIGIKDLKISEALYQNAPTTKAAVVGSVVIFYYAVSGMSRDEPSNIKRFVTPTAQGEYRVFREETATGIDITVEHYSNNIITNTLGIEQLTVS